MTESVGITLMVSGPEVVQIAVQRSQEPYRPAGIAERGFSDPFASLLFCVSVNQTANILLPKPDGVENTNQHFLHSKTSLANIHQCFLFQLLGGDSEKRTHCHLLYGRER